METHDSHQDQLSHLSPSTVENDQVHPGYLETKDSYLKRLRRIEGQVRGLHRMICEEQYCIDILTQIAAATKALESVALGLLHEHLSHCVLQAIQSEPETAKEKVAEATAAISRFVKS
ncbi:MAG: metal-sensitive transcriptional regulator [Propionibacteriaceae bacterium]|nr:metal-sensitive transcriptional regulator [Propionibacteriaceae bacterium]